MPENWTKNLQINSNQ